MSQNNTLDLFGGGLGARARGLGSKGGVRQFVMKQQKGMETQMLLEVCMVIILMSAQEPSFNTLYQTFVDNFVMVPKIYLNI